MNKPVVIVLVAAASVLLLALFGRHPADPRPETVDSASEAALSDHSAVDTPRERESSVSARLQTPQAPLGAEPKELRLRVVSSIDGSGLAGARIERADDSGEGWIADAAGWVTVSLDGASILLVESDAHCRRALPVDPQSPPAEVGLWPSGSVRVRVTDEAGEPVAEVPVALVPPDASGQPWGPEWRGFRPRLLGPTVDEIKKRSAALRERGAPSASLLASLAPCDAANPLAPIAVLGRHEVQQLFRDCHAADEWEQSTDASGFATWPGLPALDGYRWTVSSTAMIDIAPATPLPKSRPAIGDVLHPTSEDDERLSGEFSVSAGATVELLASVAVRTGVFGALPAAHPVEPTRVVVKLFHRSEPELSRARGYVSFDIENVSLASRLNTFEMLGVRPGAKLLRAWWQESGQRFRFARRAFDLEPGQQLDLGAIERLHGHALRGRIVVVDASGSAVSSEDVLERGELPELVMTVSTSSSSESDAPDVLEQLGVRLGSEFELEGLSEGKCTLSLDFATEELRLRDPSARLVLPRDLRTSLPSADEVILTVKYQALVEQHIEARFPPGVRAVRAEAHLLTLRGEQAFRRDLRPSRTDATLSSGVLSLPPGRYTLLVHTQTLEEVATQASYSYMGEFDVKAHDRSPALVALEPSSGIEGFAANAHGVARGNEILFFSVMPFATTSRPAWTHKVRTDPDGRFRLRGLPPGQMLFSQPGPSTRIGAAGAIESFRLVW